MSLLQFSMTDARRITVGRLPDNDVVVQNPLSSRRHAVLEVRNGHPFVRDCESTYGTFVNGAFVREQSLANGDWLQFGTQAFVVRYRSSLLEIEPQSSAMSDEALPLGNGEVATIGRDASCSVRVDHPTIFLQHAKVRRKGQTLCLESLERATMFSVDGQTSSQAELRDGDWLQIGTARYTFTGGTLMRLNLATGFRIDAYDLQKQVGGRPLLCGVSFAVKPGEFVGFLGPSGSGKTTLIQLLAGLDFPSRGHVFFDGFPLSKRRRSIAVYIGFVPQDDILHAELTPHEILAYTSRLRLPHDTGKQELQYHIDRLMALLELQDQSNQPVRSLSGGQKKRISIGMEMAAEPGLLALDEPTSNLDPGLEARTMRVLRKIADQKRTVLLTTHRLTQVHLLDMVGVIHEGYLVFYGPPSLLPQYFGVHDANQMYESLETKPGPYWAGRFQESDLHKMYVQDRLQDIEDFKANAWHRSVDFSIHTTYVLPQFLLLLRRYFVRHVRDSIHGLILLGQAPLIALLIVLVFSRSGNSWPMLFCMCLSCIWLGSINSVKELCKEKRLWFREQRGGLRIPSYFMSKAILLSGLGLVQVIILQCVVWLFVPLEGRAVFHTLNFYLVLLAAMCLGLTISASVGASDRAVGLLPLVLIPQILFSGAVMPFDEMFAVSRAISYATLSRWAFSASKKISLGFAVPVREWIALLIFLVVFILISLFLLSRSKAFSTQKG